MLCARVCARVRLCSPANPHLLRPCVPQPLRAWHSPLTTRDAETSRQESPHRITHTQSQGAHTDACTHDGGWDPRPRTHAHTCETHTHPDTHTYTHIQKHPFFHICVYPRHSKGPQGSREIVGQGRCKGNQLLGTHTHMRAQCRS